MIVLSMRLFLLISTVRRYVAAFECDQCCSSGSKSEDVVCDVLKMWLVVARKGRSRVVGV